MYNTTAQILQPPVQENMSVKGACGAAFQALSRKECVLVGISIRNSYFHEQNINRIAEFAERNFANVIFMCPDEPAVSTLIALGYTETRARQKVRAAYNYLCNKCDQAILNFGLTHRSRVLRWSDLEQNEDYQQSLLSFREVYENDPELQIEIRRETLQVLTNGTADIYDERAISIGAEFLLQEYPLILDAPGILSLSGSCAYLYHRPVPVLEKLILGAYSRYKPSHSVGMLIAEISANR